MVLQNRVVRSVEEKDETSDEMEIIYCKSDGHKNGCTVQLPSIVNSNVLKDVSSFEGLIELDLSRNNLSTLPENFKHLTKLRRLNLSNNYFQVVPCCISDLGFLFSLDLSHNQLTDFYLRPLTVQLLEVLILNNNLLRSVPNWFFTGNCRSLKELDLSNNRCLESIISSNFDDQLHVLHLRSSSIAKTVKKLYLFNCRLSQISVGVLTAFQSLEELHLGYDDCPGFEGFRNYPSNNVLLRLPVSLFKNAENVKVLNITNIGLPDLDSKFGRFVRLTVFDASKNDISWLPESFCELKNLEVCNLSQNSISSLPEGIGRLTSLKKLFLSMNKLANLPDSIENLKNLKVLDLYCNLLGENPEVVWKLHLNGLDLEFNNFDTNMDRGEEEFEKYKAMRSVVCEETHVVRTRGFGLQPDSCPDTCSNSSVHSERSHSEDEECFENDLIDCQSDSSLNTDRVLETKITVLEEENWDTDDKDSRTEEMWDNDYTNETFDPRGMRKLGTIFQQTELNKYHWYSDKSDVLLQRYMFRKYWCPHFYEKALVCPAIPTTVTDCRMKNEFGDYDEYGYYFIVHPEVIDFTLHQFVAIEGQFEDAD